MYLPVGPDLDFFDVLKFEGGDGLEGKIGVLLEGVAMAAPRTVAPA